MRLIPGTLPVAFDAAIYRDLHPDLRAMTEEQLHGHYLKYGINEGRRSHALPNRAAFAALAQEVDALEIGPFNIPLLRGPLVRYFDILDHAGLVERAERIGRVSSGVPALVHYVSPVGDLSVVTGDFDAVLSSHAIEHQPDLVRHLQAVERLLRPGGVYLLLVPDKRYCFDHFMAPSTIADVLDAYYSKRVIHPLRSQIEHAALTTHNNPVAHWAGEHAAPPDVAARTREALERYRAEPDIYVDVHAWYFTPTTFEALMAALHELKHTKLRVTRIYQTLKDRNEFWAALEAPAA